MPKYQLEGIDYEEDVIIDYAKKSNLSVRDYVKKANIKKIEVDVSKKDNAISINKDIANIASNVSMYDEDVNKELVDMLYSKPLEKLKRPETDWKTRPRFSGNTLEDLYVNSLEFDQKNYFGEKKYDQYVKFLETNQFNLNNASQDQLSIAINKVKDRRKKDYIANIDDKELQKEALALRESNLDGIYQNISNEKNTTEVNVNVEVEDYTSQLNFIPLVDEKITGSEFFLEKHLEALKTDKEKTGVNSFIAETKTKVAQQLMIAAGPLASNALLAQGTLSIDQRKNVVEVSQGKGAVDANFANFWEHTTTVVKNAVGNLEINKSNYDGEIAESSKHATALYNKALNLDKSDPNYNEKVKNLIGQIGTIVDYQTEANNSYNSQIDQFTNMQDKYMDIAKNLQNYDEIVKSLMLDYDFGSRASLSLEIGALETLGLATGLLNLMEIGIQDLTGVDFNEGVFNQVNQGMLDYTESVKQYKEASLPVTYKWKDMKVSNFGENMSEVISENAFSILAALTYSGALTFGRNIITTPQATKALSRTFFSVEAGGYLSRQDIGKKNAKKNIAFADNMLAQADITPESFQMYQQQKDDALRVLNQGEYEKAFSAIAYGGIAMYFEKFGTMRIIRNFAAANRATGGVLAKSMKGTYAVGFNLGIEYTEEAGTLTFHNIVDIIGGADKSIFHGLDADFNVNVLVSSLAIQGPSVSRNLTMGLYDIGTTRNKKIANRKRAAQMAELGSELDYLKQQPPTAGVEAMIITMEKDMNKLLEEASLSFTFDMAEVAQMGDKNLRQLFEFDRQLRALDQDVMSLGRQMAADINPEFYKKKLKEIQDKKKKIIEQMDALKEKPNKENLEYLKKVNGEVNTSDLFFFNYYQSSKQLAEAMGQKFNTFKDEASMNTFLDEQVKQGKITEKEANDLKENFKGDIETIGSSGSESSIGIIIREDNIAQSIESATNDFEKSFVAYTLFHEIGHQNDRSLGLFEGGKFSEENKQAIKSLDQYIEDQYKNNSKFTKEIYDSFKKRLNSYKSKGKSLREMTTLLAELQNYGAIEENANLSISLQVLFNKASISYFGQNSNLFRFRDAKDVAAYVSSFRKGLRNYTPAGTLPEEEQSDVQASEGVDISKLTPEQLVKIIQRGQNPQRVKEAYEALTPQFDLLALKALNYDTRKGDIDRNSVIAEARKFLVDRKDKKTGKIMPGIAKRFTEINPETGKKRKFSTFVTSNIAPKKPQIYEATKTLQDRTAKKLDSPDVQELAGDVNKTTNTQDTFVQKIDVLGFATVGRVVDKIKSLVKVKPGDTFKQIIQNYAGKVGSLIFDIPAKKIMEGGANLTAVTKYKEGMPVPAEGQNIQKFFNAGSNMERFIKTLSPTNVTSKTADINKVGENIEVSRNDIGIAIGLKGLPLDYFYENYTDPKSLSKDSKIRAESITSPKGRSKGITSQTQVKRLKPEFRNPTAETIEKVKQDLGITAKGQENVYSRDIGQLLKGAAKVYSINAALSAAQRVQQAKTEAAPTVEKPAIKKQTASITAAQSKAAFSEGVARNVDGMYMLDGGAIKLTFEGDLNRVDKILKKFIGEGTYKFKDEKQIKNYFKDFEGIIIKNLPRNMFMGALNSFLKPSKRIFPNSGEGQITLEDGRTVTINNFFDEMRAELVSRGKKDYKGDNKVVFGAEFKGEGAKYVYGRPYGSIYGKTAKDIEASFYGPIRKENNAIFASMHEQFMARVNTSIRKNNNNAKVWGNYFSLVGQDTEHPWRMGAEYVLFSKNPIGYDGKLYEWEHAMMATRSYLYLLETSLEQIDGKYLDFNRAYKLVMENYKLIALDNYEDKVKLGGSGRQKTMGKDWQFLVNSWLDRYFHPEVAAIEGKNGKGINPKSLFGEGKKTAAEIYNVNINGDVQVLSTEVNQRQNFSEGIKKARVYNKNTKARGMSAFDFDETVGVSQNYVIATKDGETKRIASDRWPFVGDDLLQQGWKMDFTDFNKVTDGKPGPLMQKMKNQIKKFGPKNVFILTARAPESQQAIHEYLKTEGINIPLENITGLGNSTGEAKALWMLNKFSQGYNDMYFVDDALPNVTAVKNVLEQLDIKSKVVQAKINFSEGLDRNFNKILQNLTGIDSNKRFDFIKARKRGADKGKFRYFIPPSHEDFAGLLYNFMGKGKEGDAHREFLDKSLIRPVNRANKEYDTARQSIATDYKNLNKEFKDVKKKLTNKTPDGDFTYQDAVRVYLWDKHGHKIPGLSEVDQTKLVDIVNSDQDLKTYAETINIISKQKTYVNPTDGWNSGDIRMDLDDATGRVGRAEFFKEFQENADAIFSIENLNKIEAGYGKGVREALEDILYRIKTGRNRPSGQNEIVNRFMNYLNGSVGSVMFFNMRSALLQQMSIVNYINFADNNLYAAGKAFANQPQYWADWAFIFNSDMLKQRRGGIQTDVNGAELAASMRNSQHPTRFLISKLLEIGFAPTQIADNIAIATGGAPFYRNRINFYLEEGLNKKEAETKAFTDFQNITQSTQQSARPDMVSMQQASVLGKVILNFQNVTSQFNRLGKKAFSDIKNRRITPPNKTLLQSDISNAARITYYFAIQNLIFYTLQTALFAMMFDDDEDDDNKLFLKKKERLINGSIDSVLRGSGVFGAIIATLKNVAIAFARQRDVNYNPDESAVILEALNLSPVLGIKARKVVNAEKSLNYNKKVIDQMKTFDIDNPQWSAATSYIEGFTNLPLNRLYNKTQNVRQGLNNDHANWQRTLMFLGWSQYNLNVTNKKMDAIKKRSKKKKRKPTKFTF